MTPAPSTGPFAGSDTNLYTPLDSRLGGSYLGLYTPLDSRSAQRPAHCLGG